MIPLGTDRPLRRPTLVTYALIGLNLAVFAVQKVLEAADPAAYHTFEQWTVLFPSGLGFPDGSDGGAGPGVGFHWWALITYAFLHGGPAHLLGNMIFLYVFGPNIEDRLGRIWFAVFYILGGAAAGAVQVVFAKAPVIGASGAIAACTGAYFVMFPRTHVKVLFFFITMGVFNIPAWWFIGFSVAWDVWSQSFSGAGGFDHVAHLAHLGGYAFGMVVALILLALKVVPREAFDLFTMGRQAYRRRQFKEAGLQQQARMEEHWRRAKEGKGGKAGHGPHGPSHPAHNETEAIAESRAAIAKLINAGDLAGAAKAYKDLVDHPPSHAASKGATTLPRKYQYELANWFYQEKDHDAAAYAYQRLLEAYPKDPEAGHIRLLLGMIHARTLNDPVKAKALIGEALKTLEEPEAGIARRELEALG